MGLYSFLFGGVSKEFAENVEASIKLDHEMRDAIRREEERMRLVNSQRMPDGSTREMWENSFGGYVFIFSLPLPQINPRSFADLFVDLDEWEKKIKNTGRRKG